MRIDRDHHALGVVDVVNTYLSPRLDRDEKRGGHTNFRLCRPLFSHSRPSAPTRDASRLRVNPPGATGMGRAIPNRHLGNQGCRPRSPTAHYTSWYEGLGPHSHVNVGCRQELGPGR